MIKIELTDGSIIEHKKGISLEEVTRQISEGLLRNATAVLVNGKVEDLRYIVNDDIKINILTFKDLEGKKSFWHTGSHILAQAVKRLFPDAKLAIGPSTNNGFYYDFEYSRPFLADDIVKIEAEMKKIVKENLEIEAFILPRDEALEFFKDEPFKIELINELPEGEDISFYKQGDFVDLCAGPHIKSTKALKAIKILSEEGSTAAYWRGDENNAILNRIYAIAFPKKSELDEHLLQREEALKRDHNKLGRELGFFSTSSIVGQGLPLLGPKGYKVFQILQRFVEDEEERRGYQLTKTPFMAKSDLYKVSGHWDKYRDGMFVLGDPEGEGEVLALRPMTCPFQFEIYNNSGQHSYRDLPVRYSETATLFRKESSGEMHGLIRIRQFTLADGHIICTNEQLEDEFNAALDLSRFMMKTFGLEKDLKYRFSKWDPNKKEDYLGDEELWNSTQNLMRKLLIENEVNFYEEEGEAAFYGPKLDIEFTNVHGKQDTLFTLQIDYALAEKFDMTYIDADGSKKYPVVIHRSSIGCYERTIAMLIEKYAGSFPTWLSPTQVSVLAISDKHADYASSIVSKLKENKIRAVADLRAEKIGYKIREARLERSPYILVLGDKEVESNTVSLRSRKGEQGSKTIDELIHLLRYDIDNKVDNSQDSEDK